MEDKDHEKIETIEELAGLIYRTVPTKDEVNSRFDAMERLIRRLPTREDLLDYEKLQKQHGAMWEFLKQHFNLREP